MRLNADGSETAFVDELLSDTLSALTGSEAWPATGTPNAWKATAQVFGGTLIAKVKVYAWALCGS